MFPTVSPFRSLSLSRLPHPENESSSNSVEFHRDEEGRQAPAHRECNLMGRPSGEARLSIKRLMFPPEGRWQRGHPVLSGREGSPEGANTLSSEVKQKREKRSLPSSCERKNFWSFLNWGRAGWKWNHFFVCFSSCFRLCWKRFNLWSFSKSLRGWLYPNFVLPIFLLGQMTFLKCKSQCSRVDALKRVC